MKTILALSLMVLAMPVWACEPHDNYGRPVSKSNADYVFCTDKTKGMTCDDKDNCVNRTGHYLTSTELPKKFTSNFLTDAQANQLILDSQFSCGNGKVGKACMDEINTLLWAQRVSEGSKQTDREDVSKAFEKTGYSKVECRRVKNDDMTNGVSCVFEK